MSCTYVHICNFLLHLIQNQVQSQKNNPDHIFVKFLHLLIPTLCGTLFVLSICLVHQMFVTRSAGSFVAGGIVSFVFGNAVGLVVFDSFGFGGAGKLASEVAVHLMPECLEYFAELVFDGHCSSPPLYFYKWGNLVPIHISLPLAYWQHGGLLLLEVWLYLYGGDLE